MRRLAAKEEVGALSLRLAPGSGVGQLRPNPVDPHLSNSSVWIVIST
jgi:hypothetical protein